MNLWKVGWTALLLVFLSGGDVSANESAFSFLARPLSLCVGELDKRAREINPVELFDLRLQSELYAEEQKPPGWMKKSCQEGMEEWIEKQEWYQNILERIERWTPRVILRHDSLVVVERQDGEYDLKLAPRPKKLKKHPDWRLMFGLDIDTDINELRPGDYLTFITPALKLKAFYKDVLEIRAKANPLDEIYRAKISFRRYYFDRLRPELSYKNEGRNEKKKHVLEAGVDFKTGYPGVHAGISGEINLENISDWGVRGVIYGLVDWECILIPSWCKKKP